MVIRRERDGQWWWHCACRTDAWNRLYPTAELAREAFLRHKYAEQWTASAPVRVVRPVMPLWVWPPVIVALAAAVQVAGDYGATWAAIVALLAEVAASVAVLRAIGRT